MKKRITLFLQVWIFPRHTQIIDFHLWIQKVLSESGISNAIFYVDIWAMPVEKLLNILVTFKIAIFMAHEYPFQEKVREA